MGSKEIFFQSGNFQNLREVKHLEELTRGLVDIFEKAGFEFYPEWRDRHSSGAQRNFTFKAKQPSGREENIITVYPMSGWLKIEVYRGQHNKKYYRVGANSINDAEYIKVLLDDARDIYNSISTLKI